MNDCEIPVYVATARFGNYREPPPKFCYTHFAKVQPGRDQCDAALRATPTIRTSKESA